MISALQDLHAALEIALNDSELATAIEAAAVQIATCLTSGHKLLIAGNGGSAAEAQHFSAEIVGRYMTERKGYPAIALSTDTSILTAVGNDYGFDTIFSRQIEAHGKVGDVVILLSTSGNSPNLLAAAATARAQGCMVIGLLGKGGGALHALCDVAVLVPSSDTPRIQEIHLALIHAWCAYIDEQISITA